MDNNNSITSFFEEDHDRLDSLFTKFQVNKHADRAAAAELFGSFTNGLLRHIDWEEQILFPLFEASAGSAIGPTQVMRSEHSQIKNGLEQIRLKVSAGTDSTGDEQMLLSLLGEHNYKEEQILYPSMDRQLTSRQVGEVFERIKASL